MNAPQKQQQEPSHGIWDAANAASRHTQTENTTLLEQRQHKTRTGRKRTGRSTREPRSLSVQRRFPDVYRQLGGVF